MQHMYGNSSNENLSLQRDNEVYGQSSHFTQNSLQSHVQYQHENQSISPQQSSASDIDEASPTPSSSLNRTNNIVPNKIVKKKKQTKKKRKDPNEPQKPVSPYALFFRDAQNDIKKKLSNPSFGEISKVVAHMWENIEPEIKEQYKRKAATAKKEYLKQLAAYRAVQISHQTPNMSHFLHQTSLPFNSLQHQQKPYHTGSVLPTNHPHHHNNNNHSFHQFCPSSSSTQHQTQSYNNFHYLNTFPQDNSNVYHADHSNYFSNHSHPTYSSYDSNNNYPDYHQYGLLRPAIESEHYSSYYSPLSIDNEHIKTNENLLHNLNNNTPHYTDLTSMTNGQVDKHYDYVNNIHHGSNERKDDHSSLVSVSNENNFYWNQPTCLTTQW
ncbi:unnamed protein product [Adineta steineri]|uniref:HMG box domain-containing protein n=1 Tax=Adineta steineri TaxID=433720 RepID=A0A813N680_9BILA|nr:unnamed protein product [Adineta steineri]CAF1092673.1 unnamed protein product [Adineta steineri]